MFRIYSVVCSRKAVEENVRPRRAGPTLPRFFRPFEDHGVVPALLDTQPETPHSEWSQLTVAVRSKTTLGINAKYLLTASAKTC